jgi:hypothetical protein
LVVALDRESMPVGVFEYRLKTLCPAAYLLPRYSAGPRLEQSDDQVYQQAVAEGLAAAPSGALLSPAGRLKHLCGLGAALMLPELCFLSLGAGAAAAEPVAIEMWPVLRRLADPPPPPGHGAASPSASAPPRRCGAATDPLGLLRPAFGALFPALPAPLPAPLPASTGARDGAAEAPAPSSASCRHNCFRVRSAAAGSPFFQARLSGPRLLRLGAYPGDAALLHPVGAARLRMAEAALRAAIGAAENPVIAQLTSVCVYLNPPTDDDNDEEDDEEKEEEDDDEAGDDELLVPEQTLANIGLRAGDTVAVRLHPCADDGAAAGIPPEARELTLELLPSDWAAAPTQTGDDPRAVRRQTSVAQWAATRFPAAAAPSDPGVSAPAWRADPGRVEQLVVRPWFGVADGTARLEEALAAAQAADGAGPWLTEAQVQRLRSDAARASCRFVPLVQNQVLCLPGPAAAQGGGAAAAGPGRQQQTPATAIFLRVCETAPRFSAVLVGPDTALKVRTAQ